MTRPPRPRQRGRGGVVGHDSTFSMVKRKFGGEVRSKTDAAMANEVYCKLIAHNLCVLVQEQHELGIEPLFSPTETAALTAV